MFKWRKSSSKATAYEPKTPKISSIQLPDERYTPLSHQAYSYSEKPRHAYMKKAYAATPDRYGAATPMYDSWHPSHAVVPPSSRSRTRTVSTPTRDVEAPRPIRPHPSQGPFIPVKTHADRIRIDTTSSSLAPVGVPSAAYLEAQLRQDQSKQDYAEYLEEMDRRAKAMDMVHSTVPSKAFLQAQEEEKRRHVASVPPTNKYHSNVVVDDDDEHDDLKKLKPVPVVSGPSPFDIKPGKGPLKSALKKTGLKPPVMKSLFKAREWGGDSKAYYSENESDRRREYAKPKVITTPSKAFLEQQKEQQQAKSWASAHKYTYSHPPRDIPQSAFQQNYSSSTESPQDSLLSGGDPRQRSRRASHTESSRPHPTNYMPAYIKESQPQAYDKRSQAPIAHSRMVDPWATAGPNIEWPLVDYDRRLGRPEPAVYFDVGFNPRKPDFEVKAKRGKNILPLAPEERNLLLANNCYFDKVIIHCRAFPRWPIVIRPTHKIRVIDVFRAMYDTYAIPLTSEELALCGPDYIRRCERSYFQRCKDAPEPTHLLENQGMTRIDLLRGRRFFKGLAHHQGRPFWEFELLFDNQHEVEDDLRALLLQQR